MAEWDPITIIIRVLFLWMGCHSEKYGKKTRNRVLSCPLFIIYYKFLLQNGTEKDSSRSKKIQRGCSNMLLPRNTRAPKNLITELKAVNNLVGGGGGGGGATFVFKV